MKQVLPDMAGNVEFNRKWASGKWKGLFAMSAQGCLCLVLVNHLRKKSSRSCVRVV